MIIIVIVIANRRMSREIAERKAAEALVAKKEQQLRTAMENMPGGMVMVDEDLGIVLSNEQFQQMFDLPDDLVQIDRPLIDAFVYLAQSGVYGNVRAVDLVSQITERFNDGESHTYERHLSNGKIYEMSIGPTPSGGSVAVATDITERKQAEQIVADQRQALKSVLENTVQAIIAIDKNYELIVCNARFQNLLSLPEELTVPGTTTRAIVEHAARVGFYGEGEQEELIESRMKALTSGKPLQIEMNTTDGLTWYATLQPSPEGGFVLTYTDITERKIAELELDTQRANLRHVLENVAQGIVKWGPDKRLVSWNEHYQQFLSLPNELMVEGAHLKDITMFLAKKGNYGEGDPDKISDERIEFLFRGKPFRGELTIDDSITFDVIVEPTDDQGVIITYTDITERKQMEEVLQKSEQQFRRILDDSPVAIAISIDDQTDEDGLLQFANPEFHDMTGVSPEQLSKTTTDIFMPADKDRGEQEAALDQGLSLINRDQIVNGKNGSKLWTLMSISPIEYQDRKSALIWLYDITERKQAEQELGDAYKLISSSINYASRIQRSVLPKEHFLENTFQDHFVLWSPRNVVGGDIYWCHKWGDGTLVILGDCTGHGVPGAFMTLIATRALNRALADVPAGSVNGVLQRMNQFIQKTLGQDEGKSESDDGLELGACFISMDKSHMIFAGARFDLFIAHNGDIERIKGTRSGIGYSEITASQVFEETRIDIEPEMSFYMTTDGAIDQIGKESQRKYGTRRFQELLNDVQDMKMRDQKDKLWSVFTDHRGTEPRFDDIAIIGFRAK